MWKFLIKKFQLDARREFGQTAKHLTMKAESLSVRIVYLSFVNYLNKHYVRQIDVTFKNFFTKEITLSKGRRKKLSDKCILNIVKGTGIPPTCDTDVSPTSGKLTSPRGYGVLAVA